MDEWAFHLPAAAAALVSVQALPRSAQSYPTSMMALIESGVEGLDAARRIEDAVRSWLDDHHPTEGPFTGVLFRVAEAKLEAPVADAPLIIGVIGNSPTAVRPANLDRYPDYTMAFLRPASCLAGPDDAIHLPPDPGNLFMHAELTAVLGRDVSDVDEADSLKAVFGFTVTHDLQSGFLEQEVFPQIAGDDLRLADLIAGSFYGKWWPGYAPIGPLIVTPDEIPDPYDLLTYSRFEGAILDRGHTCAMLFGVERVIASLSKLMTLKCGTLVHLGTMHTDQVGIMGAGKVAPGSVIEAEVERIGVLRNTLYPHDPHRSPAYDAS